MNKYESKHISTDFNPELREKSENELLELFEKYKNKEIHLVDFWNKFSSLQYFIDYIDSETVSCEYECYVIAECDKSGMLEEIASLEELINEKRKNRKNNN